LNYEIDSFMQLFPRLFDSSSKDSGVTAGFRLNQALWQHLRICKCTFCNYSKTPDPVSRFAPLH
ncbi:hypothetical protein P4H87_28650, partial [Paenibacillus macerans]|uniref:hypothetical protein n=1 Tax=Paenibacillus macerans TaxID=44252 RepID=UPI002DB5EECE